MTLNVTGFVSWFKIVNPGTSDLEITADMVWTLADGTEGSVSSESLGLVDAGGIYTVSEAALLAAMEVVVGETVWPTAWSGPGDGRRRENALRTIN